jgi:predicted transcriptional regulator
VKPLPRGPYLLYFWKQKLGKAEREILQQIVTAYPKALDLQTAAKRCNYAPDSGGVRNAAGKLRTLMLVEGNNAGMTANERLVR